jgi:hypothetical protein
MRKCHGCMVSGASREARSRASTINVPTQRCAAFVSDEYDAAPTLAGRCRVQLGCRGFARQHVYPAYSLCIAAAGKGRRSKLRRNKAALRSSAGAPEP